MQAAAEDWAAAGSAEVAATGLEEADLEAGWVAEAAATAGGSVAGPAAGLD
jgi:hypothetical protein